MGQRQFVLCLPIDINSYMIVSSIHFDIPTNQKLAPILRDCMDH